MNKHHLTIGLTVACCLQLPFQILSQTDLSIRYTVNDKGNNFNIRGSRSDANKIVKIENTSNLAQAWDLFDSTALGPVGIVTHPVDFEEDKPNAFYRFSLNEKVLRTPETSISTLNDFEYTPKYAFVGEDKLRIAYLDEGEGDPVILLHGIDCWSYTWRNYIEPVTNEGFRVIAVDMIGFGRSDKLAAMRDHSKEKQQSWLGELLVDNLDVKNGIMVASTFMTDVAARLLVDYKERFDGYFTICPSFHDGSDSAMNTHFQNTYTQVARAIDRFAIADIIRNDMSRQLTFEERKGYNAPFPTLNLKQATLAITGSIEPSNPRHASGPNQREYWNQFKNWEKPLLVISTKHIVQQTWIRPFKSIPGHKDNHISI